MPAAVAVPLIIGGVTAATSIYGANRQSNAVDRSQRLQVDAANRQAEIEKQIAEQQLAFQREQADLMQRNFNETRNYNRGVYEGQQKRLQPYRQFGQASLAQLGQPIPGMR